MRISIAIFVAIVVCNLASASDPAQLKKNVPGSTNSVEKANGGARFLRKKLEDENDGFSSEERTGGIGTKIKSVLNGNEKLARMFKKADEKLMSNNIGPGDLFRAAEKLKKAGYPAARVETFLAKANQYDDFYYKNFKDVQRT